MFVDCTNAGVVISRQCATRATRSFQGTNSTSSASILQPSGGGGNTLYFRTSVFFVVLSPDSSPDNPPIAHSS